MMRDGGWSGEDWVLMSVGMLVFWTLVVAGVVWLVRVLRAPVSRSAPGEDEQTRPAPDSPHARAILDERYSRGEIDDEQYRTHRDLLNSR
jgi:putative membrane protein